MEIEENERSMKYFIIFALVSAVLLPILGELYVIGKFYCGVSQALVTVLLFVWTAGAGGVFGRLTAKKAMLGCAAFALSSLVLSMVGYAVIHPIIKRQTNDLAAYFDSVYTASTDYYIDWVFYWVKAVAGLGLSFLAAFVVIGIRKLTGRIAESDAQTSAAIDNAFSENDE
ncbi:MAG: hypothetical protein K6B74_00810 [Ruminococcus sp.]|nr:hypothetical protein [Ruminococcus sp.]